MDICGEELPLRVFSSKLKHIENGLPFVQCFNLWPRLKPIASITKLD